MDKQLEKHLSEWVVSIGREGNADGVPELLAGLKSSSDNVRRLSASSLGKLAWLGIDQKKAVSSLLSTVRKDPHVQTRQSAIKALKAFGTAAEEALRDLHDIAINDNEEEYLRRDAVVAVEFIEETLKIKAESAEHHCQRCTVKMTAEEYARSHQTFHRKFCNPCFDEMFLKRRNFETQIEVNKAIEARDGIHVQLKGEHRIAEWLMAKGISYRYDAKYRIVADFQVRPDFYLPELDLYIEYWDLESPQAKKGMQRKQALYQQQGRKLISVFPPDLLILDQLLCSKFRLFGFSL